MLRKLLTALILVPLAILLVAFAVANRASVIVSFDPFDASHPALALAVPLFALLLAALLAGVVINEFLAHTDDPELDYVELYNHANQAVDLSGCILTDDPATNKFVVPPGTTIPARGFVVYTQTTLNFALNAAGETIYLKNPS